jgi:hypothetical protein
MGRKKAPALDSRETLVEPLDEIAEKPRGSAKIRDVIGVGAVSQDAKTFTISRIVKDGRERTGFEPLFIATEDGIENRHFPISMLSTAWIREKFGPGRYRVTMRDELGKPRFGHRIVGVMSSKEEEAKVEKRPPPRTPEELELERERMKLEFEMQTLKERRDMQDRFFTEMKDLLLSARPQPATAAPVDVRAEVDRALAEERRYSELQTKLAVMEATGFEDDDETPARAPKLTDMEKTLGTVKGILELAQPLLSNPLISNALQLLAAPYLEKLALSAQEKIAVAHEESAKRKQKPETPEKKIETAPSGAPPHKVVEGTIEPPAPAPSAARKRGRPAKANGANGSPVRRKVHLRAVPDAPPEAPTPPTDTGA